MWKGGIRRGQTQKAPPAAPSTVRLGGATERYRWEAGAGIGQRARRGSKGAAAKGTRRAIAPGWARDPSLMGADRARRARGRSAGEGLRRAALTWPSTTGQAPYQRSQPSPSFDAVNLGLPKQLCDPNDLLCLLVLRRPGCTAGLRQSRDLGRASTRNLASRSGRGSAASSGVALATT